MRVQAVLNPKILPFLVLLLGAAPLVVAYVSEYFFDKYPCHLCLLQRYPYMVVMGVAVLVLLVHKNMKAVRMLVALALLACVVDAGIAAYHVGVEQKWITGPEGCTTGGGGGAQSLDALRAQILGTAVVMCDNPSAMFLGVSMAGWNVLYALFAASSLGGLLRIMMRKETGYAD